MEERDALSQKSEQLLLAEVQLLLAEKRTYFAMLRTGIAVFTLPLAVIGFLITTTQYHKIFDNFWLSFVVLGVLGAISAVGMFLYVSSNHKILKITKLVDIIKKDNKRIAEIVL